MLSRAACKAEVTVDPERPHPESRCQRDRQCMSAPLCPSSLAWTLPRESLCLGLPSLVVAAYAPAPQPFSACPRRPAPRPRVYRALLMPRTRSGAAEATVAPEGGRADADHANTRDHRQDAKFESRPLRQEVQATAQQWLFLAEPRNPRASGERCILCAPSPRRMASRSFQLRCWDAQRM